MTNVTKDPKVARDLYLFNAAAQTHNGDYEGALRTIATGADYFFTGETAAEDQAMCLNIAKKALDLALNPRIEDHEETAQRLGMIGRNMVAVAQKSGDEVFRAEVNKALFSALLSSCKSRARCSDPSQEKLIGALQRACINSVNTEKHYPGSHLNLFDPNDAERNRHFFLLVIEGGADAPVEAFDVVEKTLENLDEGKRKRILTKDDGALFEDMQQLVECMNLRGQIAPAIARLHKLFAMTNDSDIKKELLKRAVGYVERAPVGKQRSFGLGEVVGNLSSLASAALAGTREEIPAAVSAAVGLYLRDGMTAYSYSFEESLSRLATLEEIFLVEHLGAQPIVQRGLLTLCAAYDAAMKERKDTSSAQKAKIVGVVRSVYTRTESESVARLAEAVMKRIADEPLQPAARKMLAEAGVVSSPVAAPAAA